MPRGGGGGGGGGGAPPPPPPTPLKETLCTVIILCVHKHDDLYEVIIFIMQVGIEAAGSIASQIQGLLYEQ